MLRFDHMPSDFNELFLFLGDAEDLSRMAETLRSFAAAPTVVDVRLALRGSVGRAPLSIVPESGEDGCYGLRADGRGGFRWGLNGWQAEQIANRIEALTPVENKSGSEIFELGVDGEIPVKVSRGEFEDEFLIKKF